MIVTKEIINFYFDLFQEAKHKFANKSFEEAKGFLKYLMYLHHFRKRHAIPKSQFSDPII